MYSAIAGPASCASVKNLIGTGITRFSTLLAPITVQHIRRLAAPPPLQSVQAHTRLGAASQVHVARS